MQSLGTGRSWDQPPGDRAPSERGSTAWMNQVADIDIPLTGQGRNGRREAIFHLRTFESRRVCRLFVMLEYLDIPAIGWGWMCQAAQQGLFRPEMQQSSPAARSRSFRFRHRPDYSDPSDRKFNTCPILQTHVKCVGKH